MKHSFLLFLLIITSSLYSQSNIKLKKGVWNANLKITNQDNLPFILSISKKDNVLTYSIINGQETILLDPEIISGDSTIVKFPYFNSELVFKKVNKRKLIGVWKNYNKGENYNIPFFANYNNLNQKYTSINSVSGKWAATFEPNTNNSYPAVGIFKQCPNSPYVTGTFLTETGDYRYLSGHLNKDSLYLSCFDGSHAFYFKAAINADSISGEFFSGKHWGCKWEAFKNDNATLKSPEKITYIKPKATLNFELPDLDSIPYFFPNDDTKEKVVIIQIMGTWCPNCLDETMYYKSLYEKYNSKGLEIIAVCYETGNSFNQHTTNINRLKNKLNINYKLLVGGAASKDLASIHFNMLNEVISFPTSIFIDKSGNVRRVHTGFNGPGTGTYYNEYIEKTNSLIEELLAE